MPVFTFAIVDILPLIPPAGFLTHAWIYDDNFWFVRNKSHAEFTHFASLPYRMLHNESQMLHGEILVVVLFFLMKKSVFFFVFVLVFIGVCAASHTTASKLKRWRHTQCSIWTHHRQELVSEPKKKPKTCCSWCWKFSHMSWHHHVCFKTSSYSRCLPPA